MGSEHTAEHYCLRWNNHQSNLLGVFSQLLQDESLVDVTLACSEGASIRAHKVVLSACSSYFQSLFLDHPSRHPIVILKDVRFAELRTLIEFMYKGEVNVQYCQLSALLKTAESLKVKGLAEMTNQSSALREPEREQDHLRPPTSSPQHLMPDTPATTTTNSSSKRLRCSPSPPPRHHHQQQQQSPLHQIQRISPNSERHHRSGESPPVSNYPHPRKINRERERDYKSETGADDHSQPLQLKRLPHRDDKKQSDYPSSIDDRRSRTPDEDIDDMDDEDDAMSNDHETGINMTINSNSLNSVPPIRKSSSPTIPSNVNSSSNLPSDIHPPPPSSSASSSITSAMIQVGNGNGPTTGNGTSGSGSATTTSTCTSTSSGLIATSSGITSPMSDPTLSTEPIAGPSGLGPVQSVPLSLKKEMDWDRSDDKSTGESTSDYRHAHDSIEDNDLRASLPPVMHISTGLNKSLSAPPTPPFGYPLSTLGLGLFDADPSRILSILHHQTLLAEEALRYRGILPSPKESSSTSPNPLSTAYFRMNPTFDMLFKGQEQLLKQANSYKNSNRFAFNAQDARRQSLSRQQSPQIEITMTKKSSQSQSPSPSMKKPEETVQNLSMSVNDEDIPDDDDEMTAAAKIPLDEILGKNSFLKDSLRFNCNETTSSDCSSIEEETKCVVCNANFPSVWLLEQHAALQHANLGPMDEKPFICEQCGQSYRYRSAYVKHREQNHRARLPADKLFTCDVCGMQFRYLKSFKKHRLNHALERLHGKFERRFGQSLSDRKERDTPSGTSINETNNNEMVTSSNELTEVMTDLHFTIKTEEEDDDEADNAAHSPIVNNDDLNTPTNLSMANSILSNAIKAKFDHSNKQTHIPERPISREESFTLKQPTRFVPNLHNPNSSLNLHFQQQPSVVPPQQPIHQLHHLRHNEPETSTAIPSTSTINSLINAERIPSNQMLGLNAQEASILNFLRVDAAEKQRDRSRFACPFCGKCVRSKENLKLHVRKHTGERPFVCLFCGRAFGGKSDLTRHLRIHTGERPYHCESCGKCFARADYLSKHLTTHVHNSTPR
ncbi:broad-complex core protein isoforms 1/2/3/4/5-like isoform X2 [Sitodiplosis mosellana]|uniref:broad-complex core protein isoforms 1/2/3/4/5-like isoform X2 n=1 Tax=Sitodiplosis mosellana TaxID=263140 RepID=UPI0024453473|nr:broad-complex core protein isoforms 1/2/3/4/5-like isoform X2 [Sitodiplosis mosellana]XP_055304689.1 broad-complex core protein isoforms 1/2/3/4/5-like isoform X2 [Sitodiplosis mosellana]XP_055304691.1 broad-complex core protein isoforms 1/2/3/4/5-like isoform X2 [Sitodiplosis mosellana]XP_055304692.1 broad-complex core protein isoforms 1/2/3/4/5-like isoform X2 [Sitodiplosis mosellana]XP_055304693.1 broad-complex core protein isoforms 1/2/3/4/5-like isoform X2 [Sitodiplosis mosellana]